MKELAPIAVCVPLVGAALLVAIFARISRAAVEIFATLVGFATLAICATLSYDVALHGPFVLWFGGWHPSNVVGLGIAFVVDPAGAGVATGVALIVTGAIVFSRQYFEDVGAIFYVLLLAMLGSMVAFAYAADAFDLFVFYEVFSVAAYALSAYRVEMKSAYQGAFQFALVNSVAGLFILTGIVLLEARTGELNLAAIGHSLPAQHTSFTLLALIFAFIAIGLFTRAALVPLHFWFDEVHASAPTPLCVVLSGAMVPIALLGFLRLYLIALAPALPPGSGPALVLCTIGAASAVLGSVMCLRAVRVKRMLAFATVAHAGVTVAALSAFTPEAFAGAALYFGGYAFAVAGLFMAVAVVRSISGSEIDILLSSGSGRGLVLTGSIFALGTLEVACVWPSTRAIVVETIGWHAILVLALFTIVAGATGGACLRALRAIFFAGDATRDPKLRVKWFMIAPAAFFVSIPPLTIVPAVSEYVSRAAEEFLDAGRYRTLSLAGYVAIEPRFAALPYHAVAWLAACSAVVVTFLLLSKQRIFRTVRVAIGRSGAVRFLVGAHDGDVGAYVAWIVGVVAVVTGFVSSNR